jgi:hypothetical protein
VIYRRLAGLLLLWSIVPLPFLYIVLPPFWVTAGAVALYLIARPSRTLRLSATAQNLLGVLILVAVIAAGGVRVGPLRPLGQLLLLLVSVRALMVVDRRSFVRVLPALFLAWLVSLTASTHISALLYFALSAALWWWAGMKVNLLGVAEQVGQTMPSAVRPRHAATAAVAALLLAVPVFLVMPRLRSPWIAGRGGMQSVTGFSSRVELSGVGTIRESQEEALILRSSNGDPILESWTRLRATAYERVTVDAWAPRRAAMMAGIEAGVVRLHRTGGRLSEAVELEITLLDPGKYLFVPVGAVAVSSEVPVRIDPAGGVTLAREVEEPLRYTVWVSREQEPRHTDPPRRRGPRFEPDPEVRRLAAQITAGIRGALERAEAIEAHLQQNYTYSMQGMARIGPDPVSWFLLRARQGHCEYFAGGMVVLLDAIGVPARMVGGYRGGASSSAGDEVVIREANAHTWVEVWLGAGRGWEVFDPTPASGLPSFGGIGPGMRFRFAWENLQASWDRYLLTYGLGEQLQLITVVSDVLAGAVSGLRPVNLFWFGFVLTTVWAAVRVARRWRPWTGVRRPRRGTAARLVDRLKRRLERAGVTVPAAATVRWIGHTAGSLWPLAAPDVGELVVLAERELYSRAGGAGEGEARRVWARIWRQVRARPAPPPTSNQ